MHGLVSDGADSTRPLNTYHASAVPRRKRLACRDNMPARGNAARMGPLCAREEILFLDLPRRVVGDIHRGIAPCPGERWHRVAGERLAAGDASIFARAAGDDV